MKRISITNKFEKTLDDENGILNFVCNENDIFNVITTILPSVKKQIIKRKDKIVIHLDSKEPLNIICGTTKVFRERAINDEIGPIIVNGRHYKDSGFTNCHRWEPYHVIDENPAPQRKGVIELLWDIFGGSIDNNGNKVINKNITLNYDKSISEENINNIQKRLLAKGFSLSNVSFEKESNITIKQLQEKLDSLVKSGIDINSEILFNISDKNQNIKSLGVWISNQHKNYNDS
jgi:hypothetical protein